MLAEFALTPSVFDEAVHPDKEAWRDQLRELGSNMFPRTAPWPVMISNLYGGGWVGEALRAIQGIKDSRAKLLCDDLLKNAAKTLVVRPAHGEEWPGDDEQAWGREAIGSNSMEPIDRIVACQAAHKALVEECTFIRNIDEVVGSGFWNGISSSWPQPMIIGAQVDAVRKLCVHSEFLCLITPHLYGGSDDETDFALKLIQSAFQRPVGFSSVEIDIHTEAPERPDSPDYSLRLTSRRNQIAHALSRALAATQEVRLVFWPRLLDRFIIAGVHTQLASGKRVRSPRWGVSLQHIARTADERESTPPTHWSLLSRKELGDQFERYCKDGAAAPGRFEFVIP